ncbi:MAG: hypothetical protein ACLSVD_03780 [Eggerthellaceae bacterium]
MRAARSSRDRASTWRSCSWTASCPTPIMGKDVSLKTTPVQDLLTDVAKSYQLSVSGEDR